MPLPKKPYKNNTAIFYIFVVLAILYIGYAIFQGGAEYQKEKKASTEDYRDEYILKVDSFRALEEEQINTFLRYYENQGGKDASALMRSYGEELLATEKEKMRYFAVTEPPKDFVGYQAYSYMASSLIAEGLDIIIENSDGEGRDFNTGVTLLEKGLTLMPIVSERYNTAKNLQEVKEEIEK